MAFTHKILLCYSILLLLAVLARSNKSPHDLDHIDARVSPPRQNDTPPPPKLELYIDAHEPRLPNDDYDQLKFPPIYHTPPPPKLYTDAHEPRLPNDDYDQLKFPPIYHTPPPPKLYVDAHEPRLPNDDYDQLKFPRIYRPPPPPTLYIDAHEAPPSKLIIDAHEAPPSKLIIDTPVSPPRHNDTHDSTVLPDHDGNDGYEGMQPNNDTVTGAVSTDETCYGPCSQLPKRCLIFCMDKGHSGGICLPKIIIKPNPLCCCF